MSLNQGNLPVESIYSMLNLASSGESLSPEQLSEISKSAKMATKIIDVVKKEESTTQWWTPTTTWKPTTAETDTATTAKDKTTDGPSYNQYGFTGDQSRWIPESEKTDETSGSESQSTASVDGNKTSNANRNMVMLYEKPQNTKKALLLGGILGIGLCFSVM